jgi:hypothetical protein
MATLEPDTSKKLDALRTVQELLLHKVRWILGYNTLQVIFVNNISHFCQQYVHLKVFVTQHNTYSTFLIQFCGLNFYKLHFVGIKWLSEYWTSPVFERLICVQSPSENQTLVGFLIGSYASPRHLKTGPFENRTIWKPDFLSRFRIVASLDCFIKKRVMNKIFF